jgi:ribosome-binding protein aMBF1 (putative translation factor)
MRRKPDSADEHPTARRRKRRAVSFVGNNQHSILVRFGGAVRRRRNSLGMTQSELAKAADLDRSYLAMVERGRENISLERAEKLAHALNCRLCDLLSEE